MPIVVDASAIVPLVMDDEDDDTRAASLVHRIQTEGGLVPALFWYEIRNVLARAERTERSTPVKRELFLNLVESLSLKYDFPPPSESLFALIARHPLTVYDAAYLELALRNQCPLASRDADLVKAAQAEGLEVV